MPDATPTAPSPVPTAMETPVATPMIGDDVTEQGDAGDEKGVPEVAPINPPEKQNQKAMRKRLYRVMKPRADGSLKVPQAIIEEYKDDSSRWKVFRLFEKSGYQPDWGLKKSTTCYLAKTPPQRSAYAQVSLEF